jgi:ankyrin repeat protein
MSAGRELSSTEELRKYISSVSLSNISSEKIIHLINERGADPNVQIDDSGETPLMYLIMETSNEMNGLFHDEVMKVYQFLLEFPGTDINAQNKLGYRLLNYAVCAKDPAFLEMLLSKSEESRLHINTAIRGGIAPIHQACSDERPSSVQHIAILLAHGADPILQTETTRYTALHCAIVRESSIPDLDLLMGILDKLLQYGVDIGSGGPRDFNGRSIMHMAAKYSRDTDFCTMVLRNGGDESLELRCNAGLTPPEEADASLNVLAFIAFDTYTMPRPAQAG